MMPTDEQMKAGYMGIRNSTIKTLIPTPEELTAREPDVTLHSTPNGVKFVRTPEERFENLAGYDFAPNYVEIDGLLMNYVEEGPKDGQVVILIHGQPTWSYLHRRMIKPIAEAGHRVIAIDLIGCGRSDKPIDLRYHHFETHVSNVKTFIQSLGLENITLFGQDWGSCIGLRIAGDRSDLFARIFMANAILPVLTPQVFYIPEPVELDEKAPPIAEALASVFDKPFPVFFQAWINYTLTAKAFNVGETVSIQCAQGGRPLSEEEIAAYNAPFPSLVYRAAPRAFPSMVNQASVLNAVAWGKLAQFTKPFLHIGGKHDRNFGNAEMQNGFISVIPGAKGQPHDFLDAGHFIQDNKGEELADRMNKFISDNPLP
jgi:pimeloyl-ACP methyl ester carboxylesterase